MVHWLVAAIKGVFAAVVFFGVYSTLVGISQFNPEASSFTLDALLYGGFVGGPLLGLIIMYRARDRGGRPTRGTPAFEDRQVRAAHIAAVIWLIIIAITIWLFTLNR